MTKECKKMEFPVLKNKSQPQTPTFFKPLLACDLDPNLYWLVEMAAQFPDCLCTFIYF